MRIWIIGNIKLCPEKGLSAGATQTALTARALAEQGHQVLLWTTDFSGREALEEALGLPLPRKLAFFSYRPRQRSGLKKSPFDTPGRRWWHLLRAGKAPHVLLSRSPRILKEYAQSALAGRNTQRVLEMQYPEWAQLWRKWRKSRPDAPLSQAKKALRHFYQAELESLPFVSAAFYAAPALEVLLLRQDFAGPLEPLPSGCLPPESTPPERKPPYAFGYMGGLNAENGVETLLEAFARVRDQEARLALIGSGCPDFMQRLKNRAQELGIRERVDFPGRLPFREIRPALQQCAIGLAPVSARQGPEKRQWASPLKVVEWMAAGVPLISTATPSVTQLVRDGENGILAKPDNVGNLAAAMERLHQDPALARSLALEGLKAAAARSYPEKARKMSEFLDSLQ